MSHPTVTVSVDGVPLSGAVFNRLVSLTITDREGLRSDALDMTFEDPAPHFASPRRGAVVTVLIQCDVHPPFLGRYIVNRVQYKCLPYTIVVRAHSADLKADMKASRSKYWDNSSVKKIIQEKAADYGLKAKISDAVSGHVYDWLGQQDESDLNFLARLARRHGALFSIKNGVLLWLKSGAGETADGTTIAPTVITPPSIVPGTCNVSEDDVDRFAKVRAYWQDRKGAKRRDVVVPADAAAKGEHVLRDPFSSKAEAQAAAKAAARDMLRGSIATGCSVVGRPDMMAGQPLTYAGVRPEVDGRVFILDNVTHSFSKSGGLQTQFTGKLKADT